MLPVSARQLSTGTILVDPPNVESGPTVAYCRVSSADLRDDLDLLVGCVVQECGERGASLDATVTEIDSGLNGNRAKLRKLLLADPSVTRIVVEHRDKCARWYDRRSARRCAERGVACVTAEALK
jgi:putative resolvase